MPTAASEVVIGTTPPAGGGTTTGPTITQNGALSIVVDSPTAGQLINIGDSILVTFHLHDNVGIRNASVTGVSQSGSVDLGTFSQSIRYTGINIPIGGSFRPGLRDTTIRRYLQPANKADTSSDSVIVVVTAIDSTNVADTARVRVNLVAGPHISIVAPANGDSVPVGANFTVAARALQGSGISRIDIHVTGESTWPTRLDTTVTATYPLGPRDVTLTGIVRLPLDAPLRGRVTITALATDVNRLPGASAPVVVFVGSAANAIPRVTQTVPVKLETTDSINVAATGQSIVSLGYVIRDSVGNVVMRDSVLLAKPYTANVKQNVGVNLPSTLQGQRIGVTAFAVDSAGRIGYAVAASTAIPSPTLGASLSDSSQVVFGHTYPLPRSGTIGDIAVDPVHGHVFLSNIDFNLLEVWQNSTKSYAPSGIAVGSFPWGLAVANNPDTLLVANSGGTNISKVFIGAADPASFSEDVAHRILTRATHVFTVTESRDANTGKITLHAAGPFNYSDRPQYLAQTKGGRIFYSTRPTATAPAGTIRWLDPAQTIADPHQVWQYGSLLAGTDFTYALFNVDDIQISVAPPNTTTSDILHVYDHQSGQATGSLVVSDSDVVKAVAADVAAGGRVEQQLRIDVGSLSLTDTTFVAASGNRNWVAFGEGHTSGIGRIMMMADSTANGPNFFSPGVSVVDLTNNASERVFGVALDATGTMVASHGLQSYFSFVADPFHLRLQGKFDSFQDGAGIAFHPQADGRSYSAASACTDQKQLAFVGSTSGRIQIVDIGHYVSCGTLVLKTTIYGAIRASLPQPGDAAGVIVKLFVMTPNGLAVVDVTAADIKPAL
ncbi:MAG TPA: Ig-like domain-containing protein [Gemmatimonadaceae bacterium]|nr:Ig-like domain-containing protein [Gemmatimonadaceae bacterium]